MFLFLIERNLVTDIKCFDFNLSETKETNSFSSCIVNSSIY